MMNPPPHHARSPLEQLRERNDDLVPSALIGRQNQDSLQLITRFLIRYKGKFKNVDPSGAVPDITAAVPASVPGVSRTEPDSPGGPPPPDTGLPLQAAVCSGSAGFLGGSGSSLWSSGPHPVPQTH